MGFFERIRTLFWPHGSRRRYPGYCSFCRKGYKEVGPLAEGPDDVFICGACIKACGELIANATAEKGKPPAEQCPNGRSGRDD
ncbi:MAG TPA: ClpX C4-type zinc finger protein [Pirellulaceae bacterium]|nr:ClpX C4-type zinc finger protein [Pirellulaceae bacterium]